MPFLRRLQVTSPAGAHGYPWDLPAVRTVERVRFDDAPITFLVGDNGSGKSTVLEALAVAAGFPHHGGAKAYRFEERESHSELHAHLRLQWRERVRGGFFLRAESFHALAAHLEAWEKANQDELGPDGLFDGVKFHDRSHGEAYLEIVRRRLAGRGFFCMDEPDAPLAFDGVAELVRLIDQGLARGSQYVIVTHSPVLLAHPDATIWLAADDGWQPVDHDDVPAVQLARRFLARPGRILDVLLAEDLS